MWGYEHLKTTEGAEVCQKYQRAAREGTSCLWKSRCENEYLRIGGITQRAQGKTKTGEEAKQKERVGRPQATCLLHLTWKTHTQTRWRLLPKWSLEIKKNYNRSKQQQSSWRGNYIEIMAVGQGSTGIIEKSSRVKQQKDIKFDTSKKQINKSLWG